MKASNCTWTVEALRHQFNKLRTRAIQQVQFDDFRHLKTDSLPKQIARGREISRKLVYQSSVENMFQILNQVSNNPCLPSVLQKVPIGTQLRSLHEIMNCLKALSCETSNHALQTKETLLSAMCIIKDDKIQNQALLKKLCPKTFRKNNYSRIFKLKKNFGTTKKLFNDKTKSKLEYPPELFQHATNFWIQSTHPNPNSMKTRIIRNENGKKSAHPQHVCYTTYKSVFEDWKQQHKTVEICKKHGKPVPSESWFSELRPLFIYHVNDKILVFDVQTGTFDQTMITIQ